MSQTWTIRYTGAPVLITAVVVPTLEEHGLQLIWEPPTEERGLREDAHQVAVSIIATGGYAAMKAAFGALRQRVQRGGQLEIDPPLKDEDGTYTGQFGARFDRRNRKVPEPPPDIFRVVRLTDGPRFGPHGGPLYGSVDAVAVEMKADSPEEHCCWWGKGPITEATHELIDIQPCASWEEDRGAA